MLMAIDGRNHPMSSSKDAENTAVIDRHPE
jgi:hypothetical protein